MEKPSPIKLPDALEQEAREEEHRMRNERIQQMREEGTLHLHLIDFLKEFEKKVNDFNYYTMMFLPYDTISRTVKGIIRDRLRILQDFYHGFNGVNPHALIIEVAEIGMPGSADIRAVYLRLSAALTSLNEHVANISEKRVVYHVQPASKEFDWT